jgi:hypothetical protein
MSIDNVTDNFRIEFFFFVKRIYKPYFFRYKLVKRLLYQRY